MTQFDNSMDELKHRKTTKAYMALELRELALNKKGYGVVTYDEAIKAIFGRTDYLKEDQMSDHKNTISSALEKAIDFALDLDTDKPIMKVRDFVPGISVETKEEIIGFKIKTETDQEKEQLNLAYRNKMVNGYVENGIKEIESGAEVGMISRDNAAKAIDGLKESLGRIERSLLPGVKHVGNPNIEAKRKEIIRDYDSGITTKKEMDNRLSDLS